MVNYYSMPMNFGQEMSQYEQGGNAQCDSHGVPFSNTVNSAPGIQNNLEADTFTPSGHYKMASGPSSIPALFSGMVAGGLTGGVISMFKKPEMFKDGVVDDKKIKKTFEKIYEKTGGDVKARYDARNTVINKIGKIKTNEELLNLLTENDIAIDDFEKNTNQTLEEFVNSIKDHQSLKKHTKTIKESLENTNRVCFNTMEDKILSCWDKDKKKWVKPEGMADDVFKIIKKTNAKGRVGSILKATGLGAVLGGAGFAAIYKFLVPKKQVS